MPLSSPSKTKIYGKWTVRPRAALLRLSLWQVIKGQQKLRVRVCKREEIDSQLIIVIVIIIIITILMLLWELNIMTAPIMTNLLSSCRHQAWELPFYPTENINVCILWHVFLYFFWKWACLRDYTTLSYNTNLKKCNWHGLAAPDKYCNTVRPAPMSCCLLHYEVLVFIAHLIVSL